MTVLTGEVSVLLMRWVTVYGIRFQEALSLSLAQVYDRVGSLREEGKKVVKFSVTGYSLGGLIGRYMLG